MSKVSVAGHIRKLVEAKYDYSSEFEYEEFLKLRKNTHAVEFKVYPVDNVPYVEIILGVAHFVMPAEEFFTVSAALHSFSSASGFVHEE